ncbi:MAG: autotransporter outer membrane beta-barrel domain-containing protein [Achromobacter sp.]|jgi:serine protease autotransporter|nr:MULTISPECIES: S6 family peptidase [Achromobacter]MBN9638206.1 autotransporter outer membrane beta-barrel domain-containing protein [Achromobacter sp.]CUJ78080.1 Serine protease pic autotransporter precursor [Achromobacter sp. 2789STDY5608628]
MNKIYSLKYDHRHQLIAVSELCGGRKRGSTTGMTRPPRQETPIRRISTAPPLLFAALFCAALFPGTASAGYASIEIPYQTYRDFAENKGAFQPGALGIPIYDKSGNLRGRLSDDIPFIDFSSVSDSNAIGTLIAPQYAAGVAHNSQHDSTRIAGATYSQVRRDIHPDYHRERDWTQEWDFDINRLGKLVTDAAPIATFPVSRTSTPLLSMGDPDLWTDEEKKRFPLFYRVGMGIQFVGDHPENGHNPTAGTLAPGLHEIGYAYKWATGGIVTPTWSNETFVVARGDNGLLPSFVQHGDSGSPLFAWDAEHRQWVLAGVAADLKMPPGEPGYVYWSHLPSDFIASVLDKDNDPEVVFAAGKGPLQWSFDRAQGVGSLTQQDRQFLMHGYKKTPGLSYADANSALDFEGLDAGKNLSLRAEDGTGRGEITLQDTINQGAGSLTFHDSYEVSPETDQTWMGGGIDVKESATVVWRVNGVAGDNLHKIGRGTLTIAGQGVNPGGLKVGDGKVILSQRPDAGGNVQAFDGITLSSGRAEVVLGDGRQVDPDRIQWGARGGVLNLNGNDITFNRLHANAKDHGATITNTATKTATVTINLAPVAPPTVSDYIRMPVRAGTGQRGDLYKQGLSYFVLKQNTFGAVPTYGSVASNDDWEYVGKTLTVALEKANERKREYFPGQTEFLFSGTLRDNLDVRIANPSKTVFIADGGMDLGENAFTQRQGELVFQGHPVIHAINTPDDARKLLDLGDDSVRTQSVSFDQPDWESREFAVGKLALTDTTFRLSRNATLLGDIVAERAQVILGSPLLYLNRNDGGPLGQEPLKGTSIASTDADKSRYQGKVSLGGHSTLDIHEQFAGAIDASDSAINVFSDQATLTGYSRFSASALTLHRGAHLRGAAGWYGDSVITVADGAALTLSGNTASLPSTDIRPADYFTNGIHLLGSDASVHMAPGSHSFSDISSLTASHITLGTPAATAPPQTVYAGAVTAAQADMQANDHSRWIITGDSTLKSLRASNAILGFDDKDLTQQAFMTRANPGSALALNPPPAGTTKASYTLTVDTVAASDSVFALRVDPTSGEHDQLTVSTQLDGSGNRLRITDFGIPRSGAAAQARETLLVSAPSSTPADLFTLEQAFANVDVADTPAQGNPWLGGLAVSHDADQRQWRLISLRSDAPWRLTQDRQFDLLHLPTAGRVELSQPGAGWTPHTLQIDTLIASGVHFALSARPQSGESDSILITTLAQGGDNSLDLTLLVHDPVPPDSSGALLLATAPVTTADSYFKPGSVTQGLTVYTPNLEIVSNGTLKKWQLAYKGRPEALPPGETPTPGDAPTTPLPGDAGGGDKAEPPLGTGSTDTPPGADATGPADNPADTGATGPVDSPTDTGSTGPADTPTDTGSTGPADTPTDTGSTGPAAPPAEKEPGLDPTPVGTPDTGTATRGTGGLSLFTPFSLRLSDLDALQSRGGIIDRLQQSGITANDDTIKQITSVRRQILRTSVLASLPKVAFVLETNQLNKRLGDVRQLNEQAGLWFKTSHGQADYEQLHLKHTTLQLGLDRKLGRQLYGVMGSYTQGSARGEGDLSEKHTTGGIGVYYAWINENGPFIDVVAKYLKTRQTYHLPVNLNIDGQDARSTSLLASVQAGWRQNLFNGRAFIEPSIEVATGRTSAYTLHGADNSVDVRINASTPIYAKIGAAAGLTLESDEQHALTLSAGLFRLQNLRRGGSVEILNNSVPGDRLSNPMADDSRYLVNVSLNARLSPNWRVYSQVESSFAGKLKHDYSGQVGVRYQF